MVFEGRFKVKIFLQFLERMVKQHEGRKLFLILSVHKSKQVEKWLFWREERIRLFFLPAYSPELNPDELANQDIKSNLFRSGRADDKPKLLSMLRGFLRGRQVQPNRVKRYFEGKYVAYAKAA